MHVCMRKRCRVGLLWSRAPRASGARSGGGGVGGAPSSGAARRRDARNERVGHGRLPCRCPWRETSARRVEDRDAPRAANVRILMATPPTAPHARRPHEQQRRHGPAQVAQAAPRAREGGRHGVGGAALPDHPPRRCGPRRASRSRSPSVMRSTGTPALQAAPASRAGRPTLWLSLSRAWSEAAAERGRRRGV